MPDTKELDLSVTKQEQKAGIFNEGFKKKLFHQIETEFNEADQFSNSRRAKILKRLKLYNNQKKSDGIVSDLTLFVGFNTVLAELYNDKLGVQFLPREEGDEDHAANVNACANFDHDEMTMDKVEYTWDWDTLFFSRGIILNTNFDAKKMLLKPVVLNPIITLTDPNAEYINGINGDGDANFFGFYRLMSKDQMKNNPNFFGIDKLVKNPATGLPDMVSNLMQYRAEAQGNNYNEFTGAKNNRKYAILYWMTKIGGKRYLIGSTNNRKNIVYFRKIEEEYWPVVERNIFPMGHNLDSVSVPDLLEDKQRMKAVLTNLFLKSAQSDLYGSYAFDKNKVRQQDIRFDTNMAIPTDGAPRDAITPIQKASPGGQVVAILNMLDLSAQKALATPETSQGVQPGKQRTLGETELVEAGSNTRRSLSAKIFSWSAKEFWRQWYDKYTRFGSKGDEKMVRIAGTLNYSYKKIKIPNDIKTEYPLDIKIESTYLAALKRRKDLQEFGSFANAAMQDPMTNRRFVLRRMAQLSNISKADLSLMFPKSIDELTAEDENDLIKENELPKINVYDDHLVHLEIHNSCIDNKAKAVHMMSHKEMMKVVKQLGMLQTPEQAPLNYKPTDSPPQGQTPATAPKQGPISPDNQLNNQENAIK
ncbi:MAG: hypothetical protein U9R08_02960 [Nanoarchaeota archaeon]|nr:hypothetical protein [Nanoarchaeota archaeon]